MKNKNIIISIKRGYTRLIGNYKNSIDSNNIL